MDFYDTVLHYHAETKHHFNHFARSLGYLDWNNQPDPFRRYRGAPLISLPLTGEDDSPLYAAIYQPDQILTRPVSLRTLSKFLECSLAISAWKALPGTRWALRVNPSSGNLHPTEGYLVLGPQVGAGDSPGVYHYAPHDHALERRTEFPPEIWHGLMNAFPEHAFLTGLTSIYWREAWKYGERAFRYCQHDIGHALAALRLAAASLGWQLSLLESVGDEQISYLLGLDRRGDFVDAEQEYPELLAVVYPSRHPGKILQTVPATAIEAIAAGEWQGQPNRLSEAHVHWDIVDKVSEASVKPYTDPPIPTGESARNGFWSDVEASSFDPSLYSGNPTSRKIIRQRRSAVAMDGHTSLSARAFYQMLGRLLVGRGGIPWDAVSWSPKIHLGLFVHRVDGVPAGLYLLIRRPDHLDTFKQLLRPDFMWTNPPDRPDWLPLYLLQEGNAQAVSAQVSCGQRIASDGVFCAVMIAEFNQPLRAIGPWFYRRLFWETGMIGQVLYLEAEAVGIRATGIGCFFDDPTHSIFGLADEQFQSLYHFTMGGPVEDHRLTTVAAYDHLDIDEGS